MTPIELRRSYAAAYANARSAMDSDLALGGVSRLFSAARLTSRDSLRAGRRLVTSARNIVRVYHSDEVQIERAYRDTVTFQVGRMGWSRSQQADWKARATLKESYEGSELTDSLLTYTDDLYTLLLGHWGEYEIQRQQHHASTTRPWPTTTRRSPAGCSRISRSSTPNPTTPRPRPRRAASRARSAAPDLPLSGAAASPTEELSH